MSQKSSRERHIFTGAFVSRSILICHIGQLMWLSLANKFHHLNILNYLFVVIVRWKLYSLCDDDTKFRSFVCCVVFMTEKNCWNVAYQEWRGMVLKREVLFNSMKCFSGDQFSIHNFCIWNHFLEPQKKQKIIILDYN